MAPDDLVVEGSIVGGARVVSDARERAGSAQQKGQSNGLKSWCHCGLAVVKNKEKWLWRVVVALLFDFSFVDKKYT